MSESKPVTAILEKAASETRNALGDNLVSLVLYGSHARGDATAQSDINLFLVVRDSAVSKLEGLTKVVPGWTKHHVVAPIIFEQEQLARSLDTFALEFLEMAAARRVLAGEDPFAAFTPDWAAVRIELEEEAREKLIQLQRTWLMWGHHDKTLRKILGDTVPGYLAMARGVLHLQRQSVDSIATQAVFDGTIHWPGFDPQVWRRLWETAKGLHIPSTSAVSQLMRDYLQQAQSLVRYIDGLVQTTKLS